MGELAQRESHGEHRRAEPKQGLDERNAKVPASLAPSPQGWLELGAGFGVQGSSWGWVGSTGMASPVQ